MRKAWKTWAKYLLGFPFTTLFSAFKVWDGLHGYGTAGFGNGPGEGFGVGDFSVLFEHFVQLLFGVSADDVESSEWLPLVHAHIHTAFEAEGEASSGWSNW